MKNIYLLLVSFLIFSLTAFPQWTQIGGGLLGLGQSPRICVVDSNIVWVAGGFDTSPSVYRTVDGGVNWVSIPTTGLPYFLMAIAAKDSLTAFVADVGGPTYNGGNAKLYKTIDAGLNWTVIDSTGGTAGFYNDIQFSKSNPQFGIAMSDPPNGLGQPYIVNKTTNGGVTWVKANPPGVPNSYGLYYTAYTIDPQFYGFASWNSSTGMVTSYTTTNGGNNWFLGDSGVQVSSWGDIVFNDDKQHGVMVGNEWPNIKITSNGGNNWITVNTGTDVNGFSTASWVSNTNVVFICARLSPTAKAIIRSDDNGLTWQQQETPVLSNREIENVRHGNAMYGYVITTDGSVLKSIQAVSVVPVELTSFTATTQEGTVTLNWTTATEVNNLGFEIERRIINNGPQGEWTLIGFREGYGTTTEPQEYSYMDDISAIAVTSLAYRLKQIDYDGSYEYSDEVLVANPPPIDYALHQNYPNPFNPTTKINYSIPQSSNVVIKVYGVLGNEIETLVNEQKYPGTYEITWYAENLPSGVYFYRLQAGDFVETKKMVLMK